MADQPINGLPKKTTVADTDSLLMIGASEEYQIDYGKLADALLNKLTSKTFTLDQGIKTLIAALNELNSNTNDMKIFFSFSGKNVAGFQTELKKVPAGIYYYNISQAGAVAINEDFTSSSNKDPEWHDYSRTGDGLMLVFGSDRYVNFILIGCNAVIAIRQLDLHNNTWFANWKYLQ